MFGIDDALLAMLLGGGAGTLQTFLGGRATAAQRKRLSDLKWRKEHGLTSDERNQITGINAPIIARGAAARQRQIAGAYAATGGAGTSYARSALAEIPQVGDVLPGILAKYDLEARQRAEEGEMTLESGLTSQRSQAISSGLGLIGAGVGSYLFRPQATPDLSGKIGNYGDLEPSASIHGDYNIPLTRRRKVGYYDNPWQQLMMEY